MAVFQSILGMQIQLIYLHWRGMRSITTIVYISENGGFLKSLYCALLTCVTLCCSGFLDRFWWHQHICSDPEDFVLYNWKLSLHITFYHPVHWSISQIFSTFHLPIERRFGSLTSEIYTPNAWPKIAESVEVLLLMQNILQSLSSKNSIIFMISDDISFNVIPKSITKLCYINNIKKG